MSTPLKQKAVPGCVVGIGGSAGSLEAFERFFRSVPKDIAASFVVIQHMDPTQKSLLPELLARWTNLPVEVVKDGQSVLTRRIYVREPGTIIEIMDGHFVSRRQISSEREGRPIDTFLSSLGASQGSHGIGVIFSGTGHDGVHGLRRIQEAGGRVLVQDPSEAKFEDMPESAINAGLADRVKSAGELAGELAKFIECAGETISEHEQAAELAQVCGLLQKKTGHDFSSYKKSTVARRVERRIQANLLPSLSAYLRFLDQDPTEPRALLRDLLISVSQFFRDPEAFSALEKEVIPRIFETTIGGEAVRVWVPACATGEEAYSIAMLLRDYQRKKYPQVGLQIFATDMDRSALEYARQGHYPLSIAEHISPERLSRYFHTLEKGYQASQELREICIFSEHSLLKHPPFSKLDLISCRNLFIYWEPDLQGRVLPMFHYALNPGGFLFLGPAESISATNELFKIVNKKYRIFQRVDSLSRGHFLFPLANARTPAPLEIGSRSPGRGERDPGKAITLALLESYAPPAFVITDQGEIAYYSGRTWRYIEPPTGVPSNNIFDVIVRPLRPEIHALLHQCVKSRSESMLNGLLVEREGTVQRINLTVRPLAEFFEPGGTELYLVILQEATPARTQEEALRESVTPPRSDAIVQQLEEELRDTRERLQNTIEEVKSSNEELLSMNEELQSANEELQTSKEELQSTNEELETVNAELAKKVDELDASNSDLQNFFHGTQVPILFLNREFRIQKFTPAATKIFRLIPTDLGRGILDITSLLEGSDLTADCSQVLETLQPLDRELRTMDRTAIYLMRISPYRTLSNIIAGLIVAFSDITELKKSQAIKSTLAAIVETSSDAIVGRDLAGRVTSWNKGAERIFGFPEMEAIGKPITLVIPPDKLEEFRELEKQVIGGATVSGFDTERVRKDGQRISVTKTMSPILGENGTIVGLSVIYRDVSDRKRAELEIARLAAIVRSSTDAIVSKTLQGIVTSWNEAATAMFGYTADEMIGKSIRTVFPEDRLQEEDMILRSISEGRMIQHYETVRRRRDGSFFDVSVSISPIRDSAGRVIGAAKIARDITLQKKTEAALREALRIRDEFLSIASHELKTPLTSLKIQSQMRRRNFSRGDQSAFAWDKLGKMIEGDERQVLRLTRLIDDMLDVVRLSSGKLSLKPEPMDLETVVREVAERSHEQLAQAGCALTLDVRSPAHGHWDRLRLEQVVANLLNNAMKYGARKPIRIQVDSDARSAILIVEDQGIGIAAEDQERIFKQFERAVSRNEVTGLGLGLYIVKEILDAHGGRIQVESTPGQGSRFTVTLPRYPLTS